jgi:hypothetical protein
MAQVAKLPLETMNKVLGVLGSLPYGQVAELIQEVRQATQVEEVPDGEGEEPAPTED